MIINFIGQRGKFALFLYPNIQMPGLVKWIFGHPRALAVTCVRGTIILDVRERFYKGTEQGDRSYRRRRIICSKSIDAFIFFAMPRSILYEYVSPASGRISKQ